MEEGDKPCNLKDCNILPDGSTNPKRCIHFDDGKCIK
jgi:hypothetical protein